MIAQLLERNPVQNTSVRCRWLAGGSAPKAGPGRRLAVALWCLGVHQLSLNQMHPRIKVSIDPVSQGSYLYAIICSNVDMNGGKQEKKKACSPISIWSSGSWLGGAEKPILTFTKMQRFFFCPFSSLKQLGTRWEQEQAAANFHFTCGYCGEMCPKEEGEIAQRWVLKWRSPFKCWAKSRQKMPILENISVTHK